MEEEIYIYIKGEEVWGGKEGIKALSFIRRGHTTPPVFWSHVELLRQYQY